MTTLRISSAQMTALETAGIFECPETEGEIFLANAVRGRVLQISDSERLARAVCDISNNCDELSRELTDEQAAWARADSRTLSTLYLKILKAEHVS